MWTIRTLSNEVKIPPRRLRRILAEAKLPELPRGRGVISLDQRVLVLAALKARDQGMSLTEFNARRAGLSREHLYRIAGVSLPDDLLGLPPTDQRPSTRSTPELDLPQEGATPPAVAAPAPVAPAPVAPAPSDSSSKARVWLRLPISEGVELHVAMGAVEAQTLETIMAALRPLTAR